MEWGGGVPCAEAGAIHPRRIYKAPKWLVGLFKKKKIIIIVIQGGFSLTCPFFTPLEFNELRFPSFFFFVLIYFRCTSFFVRAQNSQPVTKPSAGFSLVEWEGLSRGHPGLWWQL